MSEALEEEFLSRLARIEEELRQIRDRNEKVEADKAWETSHVRILFIVLCTYILTALVFSLIAVPNPLLNALIPTIGYFLSTLSLPLVKRWWLSQR